MHWPELTRDRRRYQSKSAKEGEIEGEKAGYDALRQQRGFVEFIGGDRGKEAREKDGELKVLEGSVDGLKIRAS